MLDDDNVYALASRVEGQDSAVQLVVVDRASAAVRSFPVGNRSALQFTQDQQAVYVISHTDSIDGAQTRRVSEVSRFVKSDGSPDVVEGTGSPAEGAEYAVVAQG